jgi:transcriptional regulator with XRE-family HTH domain
MTAQTTDATSAAVARELRAELARLDMNGSELARRIDRPQQTVNRWLKTGRGLDLESLRLIQQATGVSTVGLLQAAGFRCTQPPLADSVPAQVRRLHSGATPYRGPLRRASDQRQ